MNKGGGPPGNLSQPTTNTKKQLTSQQPQTGDTYDDLVYYSNGADEDRLNSVQAISGSQIIRAYGVPGITEAPSEQEFTTRIMDSHTSNYFGNNKQSSQLGSSSFSNVFTPKPSQHKSVNDLNAVVITKNNNTLNTIYNNNNNSYNALTANNLMTNPNNNNNNNNNIISLMNVQNLGQMNTNASGASFVNSNNMNSQRWEYSNQGTGFSNYNNREIGDDDDNYEQQEYEENSDKSDRNDNNVILKQNNINMIFPQQQNILTNQSHSARQMSQSTQMNKSVKTAKTTTNTSHPNRNNNNNDNQVENHSGESNNAAAAAVGVKNNKISPLEMICPYCGQFINTKVTFVPTWKTHIASMALCLIGFPCGLCLLPYYCQERYQTANHSCSKCGQLLAEYQC